VRTDSLFYQLFQLYPAILFELIGNPSPRTSTYSFSSQEVKQTSFIDGILVPPPYATDLPIYFIEIYQRSKGDPYPSFFEEIFLYLNDRPVNDWRYPDFTKRRLDPAYRHITKTLTVLVCSVST